MRSLYTRYFAVVLVLLSSVILFACQTPTTDDIIVGESYYIKEIRTGAFKYYGTDRSVSRPTDKNLGRNDPSYCVFESDFARLKIVFYEWTVERDSFNKIVRQGWLTAPYVTEFIATNVKQHNGQLTADLSGLVDGRVVHFSMHTDASRIYIRSDVTYSIKADTGVHTVVRNATVASFTRQIPTYIEGGKA